MTALVSIISIRPHVDEEYIAVITAAMLSISSTSSPRASILRDQSWRFSGRAPQMHTLRVTHQ
jgi:hypothetical protein